MGVKRKSTIGLKLDDRYIAILDIAVKKMKADGIKSASKTDIIRQALEIYAREKQITNENISDNLHDLKQIVNDKTETGKAEKFRQLAGQWVGSRNEIESIKRAIKESKSEAEF